MGTQMLTPRANERFGQAVTWVMDEMTGQKLSLRQANIRTGIDIDTLSRMRQGRVPRLDKVVDFARGFNLNVNEWLRLAGYEPVAPDPPIWFQAKAFELYELAEGLGVRFRAGWFHGGAEHAIETQEQAEDALRRRVELLVDDYPEHAETLRAFLASAVQ